MANVPPQPHHVRGEVCGSRAPYRRGRRATAVKVFTIADESLHVLVFGVPAVDLLDQVTTLCQKHGEVTVSKVEDYPNLEQFTDLYHLQYKKLASARSAKRKLDGLEFYGGILHVCYAPELETVEETRSKIIQRSKLVYSMIKNKDSMKFSRLDENQSTGVT